MKQSSIIYMIKIIFFVIMGSTIIVVLLPVAIIGWIIAILMLLYQKVFPTSVWQNYLYQKNIAALERKCNSKKQTIELENNNIVIKIGNSCKRIIHNTHDIDILYNIMIENDEYFFRVEEKTGIDDQLMNDYKYDIKYKCINLPSFMMNCDKLKIPVIPDIGQYGVYYNKQKYGIIEYCMRKKMHLLTVTFDKKRYCIFYGAESSEMYINIEIGKLDIQKAFAEPEIYFSGDNQHKIISNYRVYILSHKITLDRGYGLIECDSFMPYEIADYIENISYTNSSDEINKKIKDYFDIKNEKIMFSS